MYLHREWKGLAIAAPLGLRRYELNDPVQPGTGLWAIGWARPDANIQMLDVDGNPQDFYVDRPRLLVTGGRVFIRHRGVAIPGYGTDYPIYANSRVDLVGPSTTKEGLGAINWSVPTGRTIALDGGNIKGVSDHYCCTSLAAQELLQPGYYRLEVYAAAGTDASDVDNLAELSPYNQNAIHQFWATLF